MPVELGIDLTIRNLAKARSVVRSIRRHRPTAGATAPYTLMRKVVRASESAVHGEANPVHVTARRLLENVELVVHGKTEEVRLVLAALACGGHVLFDDVPGTAKTVLARAIAQSVEGAVHSRIQCTPDLQPTDATGLSIFDQETRRFKFHPGPVFANVVLVDEINRAMPKTQSALLEAMAEQQVTVDGVTRRLPDPFLLIATENPIEYEGTFPLPEAQLDRFYVRTALGYPGLEQEISIVREQRRGHPLAELEPVVTADEIGALRHAAEDVYLDELVERWIVQLVRGTRELDGIAVGASVRGSLALAKVARAWALVHGRDYVTPDDVQALFVPVLGHRLVFTPAYLAERRSLSAAELAEDVRRQCLERLPPPEPDWVDGRPPAQ
jgi:MoxR-like ATPase